MSSAGVEVGYILPALQRRLQIGGAFLYSRPPGSGGGSDTRLSGDSYDWELDQQMVVIELAALFRIFPPGPKLMPFARAGARIYLLETQLDGASGTVAEFGMHEEAFTELGFTLGGGVEYKLGPGTLTGELGLGVSNMNHILTGDSNTGAVEVTAGYRMFL